MGCQYKLGAQPHDHLRLHRHAVTERGHADRGARVASTLSEDLDQQVGLAVDRLGD